MADPNVDPADIQLESYQSELPKVVDLREAPTGDEQLLKSETRKTRAELFFTTKLLRILKDYFDALVENANPSSDFARKIRQVRQALETAPQILMRVGALDDLPIDQRLKKALEQILGLSFDMKEGDEDVVQALVAAKVNEALNVLDSIEKRPVLSHRGRGFALDEASKEAFTNLLESGVAEFEADVRRSSDHAPMKHHNKTLGESAGMSGQISSFTEEQLKNEVILQNGGHMISLKDLFDLVLKTGNDSTKINIDIKDFDEIMLDEILKLIKGYGMEHRVVIVSWVPQVLYFLYEKEPTLIYSLSYFPVVRDTSKWALDLLQSTYSHVIKDIPGVSKFAQFFMNQVGSFVAKMRAEAASANDDKTIGVGYELITDAHLLSVDEHWTDWKKGLESRGDTGVGKHTFAFGPVPKKGSMINRTLEGGGSINLQALEESIFVKLKAVRFLSDEQRKTLANMFGRMAAMARFAAECAESGIKVNIFDLKSAENIDKHFENLEGAGVQPGVVYTSNPDLVPRVAITKPGSGALREEDKMSDAEAM